MQKVAEQHDLLKKPEKFLISSYFGKEILINTEMAEFYFNLGLKITRIYEFIQFHPQKCFEMLANEIVNSRREVSTENVSKKTFVQKRGFKMIQETCQSQKTPQRRDQQKELGLG